MRPSRINAETALAVAVLAIASVPLFGGLATAIGPAHPPHAERPTAAFAARSPLATSLQHPPIEQALQAIADQQAADAAAQAASSWSRGGGGGRCASGDFECFKACTTERESHGDYGAVSSSGAYRGAWQFSQSTWESNGGTGDPASAPPEEQDRVAYNTYQARGSSPWGGAC